MVPKKVDFIIIAFFIHGTLKLTQTLLSKLPDTQSSKEHLNEPKRYLAQKQRKNLENLELSYRGMRKDFHPDNHEAFCCLFHTYQKNKNLLQHQIQLHR